MMGPRQEAQAALFYEFSLEDHVPQDHLLRSIDRFVDLSSIRAHLADFYSHTGRPSVDPELLIRMLLVGYCFWHPVRAAALRRGASESRLPVVLSSRSDRQGTGSLDFLEEPARAFPRQRTVTPLVRDDGGAVY